MPNVFKYNPSSTETQSLRRGNFYIGIGDVAKGPTNETGFWNGFSIGTFSYIIYQNKQENGPIIYPIQNDTELIERTNYIDSSVVRTTKEECFSYFAGQSDKIIVNKDYDTIVTDGLVLNFDAGFLPSYPGTGSSWYDLGPSQSNGALENGPIFDSDRWINFDGTNDFCQINGAGNLNFGVNDNFTIEIWFNLLSIPPSGNTSALCCKSNCVGIDWYFPSPGGIKVRVGIRNTTNGQQSFVSNQNMNLNRWYQVIFTFFPNQSDGIKIFINGVLDRSASNVGFSEFSDVTKNFIIAGNSALGGTPTHSNINKSRVLMYNRTLSQTEILQNYYKGPIVTDELVYACDPGNLICFDGLSTVARSLSQSFTASVSNGTLFINENGGIWDLDGTDDRINLGTQITSYNFNPSTTNFSMGGWILIRQHKNYSTVIDITGSGAARNGLFVTNTGSLIYQVRPNAGTISTIASYTQNNIALNRWYHLFLTVDISSLTAKLYVNGSNVNTSTGWVANQIPTTLLEQYLGYYRDSGISTNGRIGPVFLYVNKSLTDFEVLQNFNTQRSRFGI